MLNYGYAFSVVADSGKIEWRARKLGNTGTLNQACVSTDSYKGALVLFSHNTSLKKAAGSRVCASLGREEIPHVTLP